MINSERDILLETLTKELNAPLFPAPDCTLSRPQILERISAWIRSLIDHDFNQLIYILYRIDISEQKVKNMLEKYPEKDAGSLIAELILERTLRKIQTRRQFNTRQEDISEEDKW